MNSEFELAVQRLIDNELDEQQLADFFRQADQNPQLWRHATLAFVEDRVFGSVAIEKSTDDRLAHEQSLSTTNSRTPSPDFDHDGAGTAKGVEVGQVPRVGVGAKRTNSSRRRWPNRVTQVLMTAALVLLALNVALHFNPAKRGNSVEPLDSQGSDGLLAENGATPPPMDQVPNNNSNGSQNHLVSNEPYQLQIGDSTVPLRSSEGNEMFRMIQDLEKRMDPGLRQRALELGYQVEPNIRYISGRAQDGSPFLVPVQSYQLRRSVQ